ncbi:MAG: hypothetical protein QXX12_06415 [Nanopusillaceae archaeon]
MVKLIAVREETHRKLMELKYELRVSSIDKVINTLLEHYSKGRQEVKEAVRSEEELAKMESELILRLCREWGEESSFYTVLLVKKYKIKEKDLADYIMKHNREVRCREVLNSS